jgi:methylglutaconyl-CoA hydratase
MKHYSHIETELKEGVFTLILNRPEKRNAMNEQTMDELLGAMEQIPQNGSVRMVVLKARGKDFCAGADLDWMRNTQQMEVDQLQQQNMKLQRVFQTWFDLPMFTVSVAHGNVVGGALGIVAASDLVLAFPGSRFRFSEVTLGLIPATIAPFVLQRTQSRLIRNAMLTAVSFDSLEALNAGLVDKIINPDHQQPLLSDYLEALNKTESVAVGKTKNLLNDLIFNRIDEPLDQHTTRLLAQVRKSDTAAARIKAFFESIEKKA